MRQGDLEAVVSDLYRRHRLDPAEPESPWKVARLELGPDCFTRTRLVGGSGAYRIGERWRIAIAPGLPPAVAAHAVGHELGHILIRRYSLDPFPEREEDVCDRIGGAILAPSEAVKRLYNRHRYDVHAIAKQTAASSTWAALRLGEALDIPTVVVSPARVRIRGPIAPLVTTNRVHRSLGPGRVAMFAA